MNYVQHLNHFFTKVEKSEKIQPTHISLYLALFQLWNLNRFQNPITASRSELMKVSKISSYTTYYKCIHDLTALKWIEYSPSNSVYKGSYFRLKPFTTVSINDTHVDTLPTTGAGLPVVPFIQTKTNILNIINKGNNTIKKNYDEQF